MDRQTRRLADVRPSVLAESQCDRGEGFPFRDKAGRPGLEFSLAGVDCQSDVRCVVRGGDYEGNLSASRNTPILTPGPGGRGWVVAHDETDAMS